MDCYAKAKLFNIECFSAELSNTKEFTANLLCMDSFIGKTSHVEDIDVKLSTMEEFSASMLQICEVSKFIETTHSIFWVDEGAFLIDGDLFTVLDIKLDNKD